MKIISLITLTFFLNLPFACFSQKLKPQDTKNIRKITSYFKSSNKEGIANLIIFPIEREYPLPSIKSKQEFLIKFSEIFDNNFVYRISNSDPNKDWVQMGWRGIMFENGDIWIDSDGKVIAINYLSAHSEKLKNKIISSEKLTLHPSISKFLRPICVLETTKFIIRIDEVSTDSFRYSSWSKTKSMRDKPDLIIQNGLWKGDGSGGSHSYEFRNLEYTYSCYFGGITEDDLTADFTILRNGEVILSQKAIVVGK